MNPQILKTGDGKEASTNNVHFLKTDPKARYQGYKFYFREGLCWSDINTTFLKCRKKQSSINDVKSMSLFGTSDSVPEDYIITLINSTLFSYYVDNFVNNTQTFQINDARQLPIIIPTLSIIEKAHNIIKQAIELKTNHDESTQPLSNLQEHVNSLVLKIYNLR